MLKYDKYKIGLWTKDCVWNVIDKDDLVEFEFKPNWYDDKNKYKGINCLSIIWLALNAYISLYLLLLFVIYFIVDLNALFLFSGL